MPNPQLNKSQLKQTKELLDEIRDKIKTLSNNDPSLIFAFRRKIGKELTYDERSKPAKRRKLKELMRKKQKGICPICRKKLPKNYAVLDRTEAIKGYVEENVKLICAKCTRRILKERGYR
jgi:hypothetical protein